MAEVRFENVQRRFGDVMAVDTLDLVIEDREFMSLLGPSGCGKSTILNMVAGLVAPTQGSIYIGGKRVNDLAPKDRGVAMVFQDYALYPHMTVLENLAFPLKAVRMPAAEMEAKIHEAAEILGLQEFLGRLPRELSGGQRQRVALGRALVRRPEVFLMDEPLSNLDARLRLNMRAELKRLHQQLQVTVIYVTHDQAEAMTLSDRIAVLRAGRLQHFGSPLMLYERPCNTFVGEFMGNMPINFFPCRALPQDGGIRFEGEGFAVRSAELGRRLPEGYAGRTVLLGIRSENILVVEAAASDLRTRVEILEQLGSDLYVYARLGQRSVVIRMSPTAPVRLGDELALRFPAEHVRLFDADSGQLIN